MAKNLVGQWRAMFSVRNSSRHEGYLAAVMLKPLSCGALKVRLPLSPYLNAVHTCATLTLGRNARRL